MHTDQWIVSQSTAAAMDRFFLTILTVIMTICALLLLTNTALFMFPSFSLNLIYFPWLFPQVVHSADFDVIQTDTAPLHL